MDKSSVLCAQLGFNIRDHSGALPSNGALEALLNDIRDFWMTNSGSLDADDTSGLACDYLIEFKAGDRFWGPKSSFRSLTQLSWPENAVE